MRRIIAALSLIASLASPLAAQHTLTEGWLLSAECKNGDRKACYEAVLVNLSYEANAGSLDELAIYAADDQALCKKGEQENCARYASFLIHRSPLDPDHFELLSRACDQGIGWTCPAIQRSASILRFASESQADLEPLKTYYDGLEQTCNDGDLTACTNWARLNPVLPFVRPKKEIFLDGLKAPCLAGNARACTQLSYIYSGDAYEYYALLPNFNPRQRTSKRYARMACKGGNPTGCYNYGLQLENDWAAAHEQYVRSCKLGDPIGCEELNYESYWRRSDPKQDLKAVCSEGDFNACLFLAEIRGKPLVTVSNDPADIARVEAYLKDLDQICRMGSGDACGFYAAVLQRLRPDPAREMAYARAGCEAHSGHACYSLGVRLEKSDQPKRALLQYRQTCEMEHWAGCTATGVIHQFGRGTPADDEVAARYYQIGCDNRDARACNLLSGLLQDSDAAEAATLRSRACKLDKKYCDKE
ncbi:tetratricopeptide repeat protein [Halovulum sp. GXIMD14793]